MKIAGEVRFLLGIVLAGMAGLAGGQVWVLTDSVPLSCLVGLATFSCLWLVYRMVGRWAGLGKDRPLFGEVRTGVFEQDFTERVGGRDGPRHRVQGKAQTRPERVAGSVRAMLAKGRREGEDHPRQDG